MIQKKIPLYKNKKFLVSLIGLFIISLMVLSSLNIFETEDSTNKIKYKNYIFVKQDNQWVSYINNKNIAFSYNPLELEDLDMPDYNFALDKIYIAYDQNDLENERFVLQRAFNVFQYLNIRPVLACYAEKDCPDIPIIDCKNDNSLYLKYSLNNTKIYIQDNCLILEGNPEFQLKYMDKIFYKLLGI